MFRSNLPFKKISLLAATCGGLLVSLATLSQAGGPPPQQGKPVSQPAATEEPASQPTPAGSPGFSEMPSTTTDAPPRFPMPSARVTPSEGMIVIKLVNTTNAVINYQIVGVTPQRTLGEQSEIVLKTIQVPITLTYQRPDGGLLQVRPQATAMPGMLQVSFGATTELGTDTKSLEIQEDGKVILN